MLNALILADQLRAGDRLVVAPHAPDGHLATVELLTKRLKPETRARLEALGEQLDGGNVVLRRIRADSRPLSGTRLIREWQGVQHVVTVRADDFEFEGRPYQSLSAIARHITGTRWNGRVFFGLRPSRGAAA